MTGIETVDASQTPAERGRSIRQAARITAIVGSVFSVLYMVSALVIFAAVPGADASDAVIRDYYGSASSDVPLIVGLYVMPLAGICFIWFIVTLRMWVAASGRPPAVLQSNLQLVSGIAFVILTFVAAAASTVVAGAAQLEGGTPNLQAAREFPIFGRAITLFFTTKMAAMYVITTSIIGRGPEAFPNWFANAGFVVGAFLALSPVLSPFIVLAFPIWLLILCWIVFRAARRLPEELRIGDPEVVRLAGAIGARRAVAHPTDSTGPPTPLAPNLKGDDP